MLATTTCAGCGASLTADARFCSECGRQRASEPLAPPAAAAATAADLTATAPPPASSDPMIGRVVLGQFEIKRELGRGGMGTVYLAHQPSMGRDAVIKVLQRDLAAEPDVVRRFEREARAASQLSHPHVVTVYNNGTMNDGTPFIAMEYCAGESLADVLDNAAGGRIAATRAIDIALQVLDGLGAAHAAGVVHRDLKPGNIMLTRVGSRGDFAKLLDFGVAKIDTPDFRTRTGVLLGTPYYMSPEQLDGAPADHRVDLYALGVVLYQAITGRLPFEGESFSALALRKVSGPPTPPSSHVAGLPQALERALLQSLEREPARRFADAASMARALAACRSEVLAAALAPAPQGDIGTAAAFAATMPQRDALGVGNDDATLAPLAMPASAGAGADMALAPTARASAPTPAQIAVKAPTPVGYPVAASAPTPVVHAVAAGAPTPAATTPWRRWLLIGSLSVAALATAGLVVVLAVGSPRGGHEASSASVKGEPRAGSSVPQREPRAGSASKREPRPKPSTAGPPWRFPKLEAKLAKLRKRAKLSPSSIEVSLRNYRSALTADTARATLVALLRTLSSPAWRYEPYELQSYARLERAILTMRTRAPLTMNSRRAIIRGAYRAAVGRPKRDRDYYIRIALLSAIKHNAVDYRAALGAR